MKGKLSPLVFSWKKLITCDKRQQGSYLINEERKAISGGFDGAFLPRGRGPNAEVWRENS